MHQNSILSKELSERLGLTSASLGSLHSQVEYFTTQFSGPPLSHLQGLSPPPEPPELSEDGKPSPLWRNDTFAQFFSILVVHFDFSMLSPRVDPQELAEQGFIHSWPEQPQCEPSGSMSPMSSGLPDLPTILPPIGPHPPT